MTQQRQNSFEKQKIFTKALAKINFENHKEFAMNEVHVTTAKVVLISYQRCSCCVNHASIFLKSQLKN